MRLFSKEGLGMKSLKPFTLTTIAIAMVCGGCARESRTIEPREWTFEMEKIWEIQQVGNDELLRPGEPRVADDGTLYIHDFEQHLSYSIDGDGKLVGTFAPRGDNEGEVSFYINCFPAGDHVVICAPDKLYFFTKEGQYVRAVPNNLFIRFPLAFENENEFWVAPGALGDAPGGVAMVTHVNAATGEETVVHEFPLSDTEKQPSGGALIVGLTPQILMGYDRQSDRVYFGKNNDTTIYWIDDGGTRVDSFSFTGVRQPVSETDKRNHFARFGIPDEQLASIVEALPDEMTYYSRMQIVDGFVYLLSADRIGGNQTGLNVNVFSPDGRHVYHGRIQIEDGWHIYSSPDCLQLANTTVYAVQEDESGNKKIIKYRVALPGR
jgi:hypothetical protein